MRQLYTSPRLENVERLAELLTARGIAVRIGNRPGYKRGTKRDFSYTDPRAGGAWPVLWVIESEQYPEARQVLREAGLLDSPVDAGARGPSYLADAPSAEPMVARDPRRAANRVRLVVFAITLVLAAGVALRIAGLI